MKHTDVAIVGGGVAGSAAAAVLGRAGIAAVLIDPHRVYPPDFRCEKIDPSQARLLGQAGLSTVLDAATPGGRVRVARHGRLVDTTRSAPSGIRYDHLVTRMRAEMSPATEMIVATVTGLLRVGDRQAVTLSTGEELSARLVVLANGLNARLRKSIGIGVREISRDHSVSIGFDMASTEAHGFDFSALTYYSEALGDRVAYLTLFRIEGAMRANLFVYWDPHDPRLARLRKAPETELFALLPRLRPLTGAFTVPTAVKIRPVDLTVATGFLQPGLVLIGDAFATTCPAAGTGLNKVLTDVERLCHVHIPRWFASGGMGLDKIGAFYDDPAKRACDAASLDKAFRLRSLSTQPGLRWGARRWSRFIGQVGVGMLRRTGERLAPSLRASSRR